MNFSRVMTALSAAALIFFANGAESLPRFETLMFTPQYLQADLKCVLVNGQPVCTDKSGNNQNDNKEKKKKKKDDAEALTECTIQQGSGGGGCGAGLKRVCEKLKSGKKCCGCVPDKSAGSNPAPAPAPAPIKTDCRVLGPNEGSAGGAADPKLKYECEPLPDGKKRCCWVQYP